MENLEYKVTMRTIKGIPNLEVMAWHGGRVYRPFPVSFYSVDSNVPPKSVIDATVEKMKQHIQRDIARFNS